MSDKKFDFYGKRKVFFGISIAIIVIGIICNIIFGVTLDIQFSGGSMISYTYNGTLDENELKDLVQEKTPGNQVTFSISKNLAGNNEVGEGYYLTIQFSGKNAIDAEVQSEISTALEEKYPDNNFEVSEFSSVDPTMGTKFFVKCLVAVAIASVLMVIYVTFRFKKIGGMSAGMMGLVALFHDMVIVYIVFVLFRMPIDSNFIAVILMILGYSLNDTIVIYDRIRENKAKLGPKAELVDVYNLSMTQCIRRTVFTSITTLVAIGSVYAVCLVYNITSIQSFALPMMFGVISGCYSSICIASPLWVVWQQHKKAKETEKK
ncbi:MAG: protein translocase subunit SecF [Acutalibacteraceae bacterium]|nr:protein translocase subunit SecF [Clostridia bacterium]MEE3450919.1 protein translocase subunit SecF [Acutalibacteraceae bacterium]